MTKAKPIRRIAVIGTGVIGASWTSLYLARGLHVVATDIAPNAEASLRKFVETARPARERLGLSPAASQSNLKFVADVAEAITNADLVQENEPERIDLSGSSMASSTSCFRRTDHRLELVRAHVKNAAIRNHLHANLVKLRIRWR